MKVEEGILNRQKLYRNFDQIVLKIQKKSEKANLIKLSDNKAQIDKLLSKEKL